jgi:hypothetical protein
MVQKINQLSAVSIASTKPRGMYADGGGLYLQVSRGGTRSWIFRFKQNGKTRDMGLGSTLTLSLAEARQKATQCRRARLDGVDPIEHRVCFTSIIRLRCCALAGRVRGPYPQCINSMPRSARLCRRPAGHASNGIYAAASYDALSSFT